MVDVEARLTVFAHIGLGGVEAVGLEVRDTTETTGDEFVHGPGSAVVDVVDVLFGQRVAFAQPARERQVGGSGLADRLQALVFE